MEQFAVLARNLFDERAGSLISAADYHGAE